MPVMPACHQISPEPIGIPYLGPAWDRVNAAWSLLASAAVGRPRRSVLTRNVSPAQGCEVVMTVVQGILLAISVAAFGYLGIAIFKPEWF
jgi:F subunit of K+-transporting ATPase (Potass_KdpF)